jgi:uncharacterized repeat protein (TIGR01451 family)
MITKKLFKFNLIATALLVFALAAALPAAAQTPVPFTCTGEGYIIQGTGSNATALNRVVDTGTEFSFFKVNTGAYVKRINNLGYNTADDLLYASQWSTSSNAQLIQIDSTGAVFPITHGFTLPDNLNSGDVTPYGTPTIMYLSIGGGGAGDQKLYVVDLSGPTLVGSYPIVDPNNSNNPHPLGENVNDLAVHPNPTNAHLYGCDQVDGQLAIIDPTPFGTAPNQNVTRTDVNFTAGSLGTLPGAASGIQYGAAYFLPNGNLVCYENGGTIYEIDLNLGVTPENASPQIVRISEGNDSIDNDGAACAGPQPAIDIEKTPDYQLLASGDTATFTITVTNTGNEDLTDVAVTDVLAPSCNDDIGALAAGDSVTYDCTVSNVTVGFTNEACVEGTAADTTTVSDCDDAVVAVPAIEILKKPDSQQVATGGAVTFAIVVINTGNVDLESVTLTDDPGCDTLTPTYSGDGDSTLAPGEVWTYDCTANNVTEGFTNTATATGTPPGGEAVDDSDVANVVVLDLCPPDYEGCTPGFWKDSNNEYLWTGFSPGDFFNDVFSVTYFAVDYTLKDAINAKGGGVKKLARHGTAALLNASNGLINYPYTVDEVIAYVQAGNVDPLMDANELSGTCPAK